MYTAAVSHSREKWTKEMVFYQLGMLQLFFHVVDILGNFYTLYAVALYMLCERN